ncbi:hypothetical protein [Luteimonas sp. MC1572]|uniref:hypothetical protein n=1 Tax=Luteimonas sp. MC1572 TaxID=2799325 RepID=UPI0018F0ABFC|nr:hypothetical protein [Luteimonas sp. MC1572]MBJ6981964.1 hypothetical protein [Luteimonas sp. MC1572]QQO03265.1 hypothetical protein JGR64_00315 [Luteimonas sp. MC1572]
MDRFLAVAVLLLATLANAAQGAELDLGSLRIAWPSGYKEVGRESPIRLVGPDGVNVLITVWNAKPEAGADAPSDTSAVFSSIAESRLPELAATDGKVVVPLQRQILPDGSILYSTATQTGAHRKAKFYLQYMLIAPSSSAALFTVEGRGDATAQHLHFLERFYSVEWADAR